MVRAVPVVCFIADLVCPWCYIAFMRLQRTVAAAGAAMVWHPFLLNPHVPPRGVILRQCRSGPRRSPARGADS